MLHHLLELLLRAQVVGVAALLLAAVHRTSVQARIALAADHLLAVVLARKDLRLPRGVSPASSLRIC